MQTELQKAQDLVATNSKHTDRGEGRLKTTPQTSTQEERTRRTLKVPSSSQPRSMSAARLSACSKSYLLQGAPAVTSSASCVQGTACSPRSRKSCSPPSCKAHRIRLKKQDHAATILSAFAGSSQSFQESGWKNPLACLHLKLKSCWSTKKVPLLPSNIGSVWNRRRTLAATPVLLFNSKTVQACTQSMRDPTSAMAASTSAGTCLCLHWCIARMSYSALLMQRL